MTKTNSILKFVNFLTFSFLLFCALSANTAASGMIYQPKKHLQN